MITETDVKKAIAAYLDSLGPECWHVPFHNMGYTRSGIPDRLVCYRGRFLAIEVKRPPEIGKRGKLLKTPTADPWQQRELAAIVDAGGRAIVVWSVEHVREEIEAIAAEHTALIDELWRGVS